MVRGLLLPRCMFDFGKKAFPGMPRDPVNTRVLLDFGDFRLKLCIESCLTKQQRRAIALAIVRELAPLWHIRGSVIRHEDDAYRDVPHWIERPTSMAQAPSFHTVELQYGMKIRLARQGRELTQAVAAKLLKINATHLSEIERGKHLPRAEIREKIRLLLQIELGECDKKSKSGTSHPAGEAKSQVQNVASD